MTEPLSSFGLASDLLLWQFILLTVISLGVGILGGFVGLALGTMRLPALLLLGMPVPIAAGTNILVSTLSAGSGMIRHFREGRINFRVALVMGVPSMIGALLGSLASDKAPETLLISVAGVLVTWQGIELIARARKDRASPARNGDGGTSIRGQFSSGRIAAESAIGLAVGLLGGAVGLILGSLRLPALIRILRIEPRVAAGTNLFIGFLMGSVGWIGHAAQGNVDYPLLGGMGLAGMAGTFYGAKLTGRVTLNTLILTMGSVLLVVGLLLLAEAYRRSAI